MQIHCLYDELVPIQQLKPHPQNRNDHPVDQITRLAQILRYQGWRSPIKVSKQTGFITAGHGRWAAAIENNWSEVPVNYQDYSTSDMEYADLQADNTIASWAEIDVSGVNADLEMLSPDFNLDMLGIKDFKLDPSEKGGPDGGGGDESQEKCPECGQTVSEDL